jgi:hypothetical protein
MLAKIVFGSLALVVMSTTLTAAETCQPATVKVPCRDMGDGRTLIDSLYLPDGFVLGKSTYAIVHTGPTSMTGEWANLVCTIKIS